MVRPVVADVALSFVSDINIPQVTLASVADSNQVEEYESDSEGSDIDMDGDSEDPIISKPVFRGSQRIVSVECLFGRPVIASNFRLGKCHLELS